MTLYEQWVSSETLAAFLTGHRANDVRVEVGTAYVPIRDVFYNSELDVYVIEVDQREVPLPLLWSTYDVMAYLGISRQRVHQLADANPDALPVVKRLGGITGARLWLADSWLAFPRPEGH